MWLKIKNISSQESQIIKIITDGSASPKHRVGAWASCIVVSSDKLILKDTEENTSQHAMELKAVISSLKYIQSAFQNVSSLEVHTDSDYVLNLVKRRKRLTENNFKTSKGKEVRNQDLIRQFYRWLDHFNVILMKVEGHAKKGLSEITDYHREVDKLSRRLVREKTRNL